MDSGIHANRRWPRRFGRDVPARLARQEFSQEWPIYMGVFVSIDSPPAAKGLRDEDASGSYSVPTDVSMAAATAKPCCSVEHFHHRTE